MSNDTSYKLTFRHRSKAELERAKEYLTEKKRRWNAWQASGKDWNALMEEVGAQHPSEVVSWGFDFGEIQERKKYFAVKVTVWANENASNVCISGPQGELADLMRRFPGIDISGRYRDEYHTGSIRGFQKCGRL